MHVISAYNTFITAFFILLLTSCAGPSDAQREGVFGSVLQAAKTTPSHGDGNMPEAISNVISFETTEGTWMSVDVSPDGRALVFDLLGDLYLLPIIGGDAVALTSGRSWDQAPRYSPDGAYIFFVSDRVGFKNLWRISLADRSVHQVTKSASDIVGTPNWSQDGLHLIAAQADALFGLETALQSVDPVTGALTPLENVDGPWIDMDTFERKRDRIITFSGVQAANGEVYFAEAKPNADYSETSVRIFKIDPATQLRDLVTPADAAFNEFKPQLSHHGKLLAYLRQYPDRRTELRILHRNTGEDRALFQLRDADDASYYASHELWPNYAFTPDDQHIVFWQAGKIHKVSIDDGASVIIPFHVKVEREVWARALPSLQKISDMGEAKIIRWPSLSRDGKKMAFAAIGYVWLIDLKTGSVRRLTESNEFEYMPAISPDGGTVVYTSFSHTKSGYGSGRLMVAEIDGGPSRELLADPNATYMLPKWSPDSSKIALIREMKSDTGMSAVFGWVAASSGAFQEVASAPASDDRQSSFIYARYVGFDEVGENLLFSFPQSKIGIVLATADLDGANLRTLATGASEVGGITPAPDLNNLALTRTDGTVWILPFSVGVEQPEVSTLESGARRISDGGGYYIDWSRPDLTTFGFGQNIFRYRLEDGEMESLHLKVNYLKTMTSQPMAFQGATIITMSGDDHSKQVIESGTIVFDGQRITAMGPQDIVEIPAGALVIDVTGKTIMPGFLDTHYHRIGGRGRLGLSAFKLPNPEFGDRSAITYGVTTAWEPGGAPNDGVPATVDLQASGRIIGPRWSHSTMGAVGYPWELLSNYTAALLAVEQHRTLGVDVLKEYGTPTRKQRQWLSMAAHEQGLGIVSHIDNFDGMMNRIVDGYTGGDHPYIPAPFYKDVRELLKQTGYIWTPNVVISVGSVSGGDISDYYWEDILKKRPDELDKFNAIASTDREVSEPSIPYKFHRVSRVAETAATAAKGGVHIGVSAHNMPGALLHQEMWYLWKGGLPIEDVLRAATIGNAEKLGLQEEVGSLEVGKIADFLVLDENPLDDIINTLSLKYTVQGGVIYDSNTAEIVDISKLWDRQAANDNAPTVDEAVGRQ